MRVVPLPAAGVNVEAGTVTIEAEGVRLAVRPSAWAGSPAYLPSYVTPFRVVLTNGTGAALTFDYADLRLFDDARFQYTALSPVEVERILRSAGITGAPRRDTRRPGRDGLERSAAGTRRPLPLVLWTDRGSAPTAPIRLAAALDAPSRPILRRRVVDPLYSDPWWWAWPPYPYPYVTPRLDDVYLQALRVGSLAPDAKLEGFVYFPLLRATASRLAFEFHYRQGPDERVLALPFGVERGAAPGRPGAS